MHVRERGGYDSTSSAAQQHSAAATAVGVVNCKGRGQWSRTAVVVVVGDGRGDRAHIHIPI